MDYESLKQRFEAVFAEVEHAKEAFGISIPTEEIIRDLLTAVQAEEDMKEFFDKFERQGRIDEDLAG